MTTEAPIPLQYSLTVDAAYRRRLTWALTRFALRRVLIAYVITAALFALIALGNIGRNDSWLFFLALFVFDVLAVPLLVLVITRSRVSRVFPEGMLLESGFADTAARFRTPAADTTIAFSEFRRIRVRGGFAFVRMTRSRQTVLYPLELFPLSVVERIPVTG